MDITSEMTLAAFISLALAVGRQWHGDGGPLCGATTGVTVKHTVPSCGWWEDTILEMIQQMAIIGRVLSDGSALPLTICINSFRGRTHRLVVVLGKS